MVATVLLGLGFAHYLHVKRDRDFYREEAFNALKITKGEGSISAYKGLFGPEEPASPAVRTEP